MQNGVTTFKEEIERNGVLAYTNKGVSMMPLLRQDRDVMVIKKGAPPYNKYDAVLFMRENGQYVLHRIIKCLDNGTYYIVGDNCIKGEYVKEENIIGVLTSVKRGKRTVKVTDRGYLIYVHLWCDFFRTRVLILKGKAFAHRCLSFVKRRVRRVIKGNA